MSISKIDFKTIYNKMINSDKNTVKKYINNLNRYGKSGDNQLDMLVNNYSSNYVTKVMNKINAKVLVGGNDGAASTNSGIKHLFPATETESTAEPINSVSIVNSSTGITSRIPVTNLAASSQNSSTKYESSETSSEMPLLEQSDISSESPVLGTNDLISSNTSSEMPSELPVLSTTSSENPVVEPKPVDMKLSVSEMIEKLKHKAMLLKQKEDELKSREARLEELERNVVDKRKERENLDSEIEILKNQQITLKTNISEIEQLLSESEVETGPSFLQNIVNKVTGVFSQ